jgi:hypothetical protein
MYNEEKTEARNVKYGYHMYITVKEDISYLSNIKKRPYQRKNR